MMQLGQVNVQGGPKKMYPFSIAIISYQINPKLFPQATGKSQLELQRFISRI